MNNNHRYILAVAIGSFLLMAVSCEEQPPPISFDAPGEAEVTFEDPDNAYILAFVNRSGDSRRILQAAEIPLTNQGSIDPGEHKRVVMDYFTGVQCVNCPTGMERAEDMLDQFDGELFVASYHTGHFATPYEDSKYDFRLEKAEAVSDMLSVSGAPMAAFDRIYDDGYVSNHQGPWVSKIENALQLEPPVAFDLESHWDEESNEATVTVTVTYLEDINIPHRLTILLQEHGLIDLQLSPSGVIDDYEHNHVVRGMITPHNGLSLGEEAQAGDQVTETYTIRKVN